MGTSLAACDIRNNACGHTRNCPTPFGYKLATVNDRQLECPNWQALEESIYSSGPEKRPRLRGQHPYTE